MSEKYILVDTGDIILNSVLDVYKGHVRPDRNYEHCKRGQWVSVVATSGDKYELEVLRDALNLSKQHELVMCRDCKHRPIMPEEGEGVQDLEFPDDVCPMQCGDPWYNKAPEDD